MRDPVMSTSFNVSQRVQLMFEDPVTKELMVDPWVYSDGFTYERRTGDKLEGSPMTRRPIYPVGPNIGLRSDLFDAYPSQAERYVKRHNLPAVAQITPPPSLTNEQHEQLYSIQTTLSAARAARDDRRAQLRQGLHEIELSPVLGVLKEHLAPKGNNACIKLTETLCVTRRGLDAYNDSYDEPKQVGIKGYLRRVDVTELPSIEHYFDALIAALGRAAESLGSGAPSDSEDGSDSESDSDSDAASGDMTPPRSDADDEAIVPDWIFEEPEAPAEPNS